MTKCYGGCTNGFENYYSDLRKAPKGLRKTVNTSIRGRTEKEIRERAHVVVCDRQTLTDCSQSWKTGTYRVMVRDFFFFRSSRATMLEPCSVVLETLSVVSITENTGLWHTLRHTCTDKQKRKRKSLPSKNLQGTLKADDWAVLLFLGLVLQSDSFLFGWCWNVKPKVPELKRMYVTSTRSPWRLMGVPHVSAIDCAWESGGELTKHTAESTG